MEYITLIIAFAIIYVFGKILIKSIQIQRTIEEQYANQVLQQEDSPAEENSSCEVTEDKEPEKLYRLQTHKIKYQVYDAYYDLESTLKNFYREVVLENLWINEPFHSVFYKILLLLDKNELMIIDPNSKVLTLNIRDKYNKITTSKSYQVFSTRDIVKTTIRKALDDISRFNKSDAQKITLAICVIALKKSVHYISKEIPNTLIQELLRGYQDIDDINHIIDLINQRHYKLLFVEETFKYAFTNTGTEPYNDSIKPTPLHIPSKLPQKVLQHI